MDKTFEHKKHEKRIYEKWEASKAFKAEIDPKKVPYTIVLPPPNASGKMHTGNVLMIAIEDLLIRWKKMKGFSTLWLPGTDHAGFETQITFERDLKKQNKSRFDFDRASLYSMIWDFVQQNKNAIEEQIRSMGASVDWSRYTFTLNDNVISTVYDTFKKMIDDGLVYRDDYLVNYCPKCGTTFADLEVIHEEKKDPLYYIKYRYVENPDKYLCVATVRPETIFVDTHLAVNPKDKTKKDLVGKKVLNPLTDKEMTVIEADFVDPKFGTGIVKLTPAHDKNDYEAAKKYGLPIVQGIDMDGRLNETAGNFKGLKAEEGRKRVMEYLTEKGLVEKIDNEYDHAVTVCYKGKHTIEPTVLPNWFIKVDMPEKSFKRPALAAVLNGEVTIYPKWRKVTYTRWMEDMRDWPISRQVVWGIQIPAWYDVDENPGLKINFLSKEKTNVSGYVSDLLKDYSFEEIEAGLQTLIAPKDAKYVINGDKPLGRYLRDTDTFDTWFSSGQWPLVTLRYPDSEDFKYFYPTSVLETGWEIIRPWVSRMIMFGIYLTGKPPFKDVYLHGLVRAIDGKKMSKSLGNIINPEEYMDQYGVDALRMGLISGTANGKDFNFPRDKVIGYRNFANKLWNMCRFMDMMFEQYVQNSGSKVPEFDETSLKGKLTLEDKNVLKSLKKVVKNVDKNLDKYRFSDAAEEIYQFMWHELADIFIENVKSRQDKDVALSVFRHVYTNGIRILHPFMPFVTEVIWENIPGNSDATTKCLLLDKWPDL